MQATINHKREKALKLLDLREGADSSRVKSAFRKLAFDCHPNLHGGDPEKARRFQDLLDAYQIITDESAFVPPPGHSKTSPTDTAQGRDLHYRLRLDFIQAVLGGEVSLRFSRRIDCPDCSDFTDEKYTRCPSCRGIGRVQQESIIGIHVPPGAEDGEILRFKGLGNEGLSGGEAGDLHLLLSVRGHPALKRRGLDIYSELKLPESRFREGGAVEVSTIRGSRKISLPPYTLSGKIFQLKGLGVQRQSGDFTDYGDHFLRVTAIMSEAIEEERNTSAARGFRAAAKSG